MFLYVGVVFYSKWALQHFHVTGYKVYVLAIFQVLPLVASLAAVGLYVAEETDEFLRSVLVQSILWGLGASLTVSTVWGTLADSGHAPHLFTIYPYMSFWIVMAISGAIIRLRYR